MVSANYMELDIADEFNKIIGNQKLVVVDFYAEWCMPCLMLSPVIEDLSEQMEEVSFVRINAEDNEELSERHDVSSFPCLIIFMNGKEVDRIVGNHSIEVIEGKIKSHLD